MPIYSARALKAALTHVSFLRFFNFNFLTASLAQQLEGYLLTSDIECAMHPCVLSLINRHRPLLLKKSLSS